MPPLAALIALASTPARADDTWVVLPGLGPVPIADAIATCDGGQPAGKVADLVTRKGDRRPVFQDIAASLLDRPESERAAYWQYNFGVTWPSALVDVSYRPKIDFWPGGVVSSCYAVGAWYAGRGMKLAHACAEGKDSCRTALGEADWELARNAVRDAGDGDGIRDPYLLALNGVSGLSTYRNPLPFLTAACEAPSLATKQQRWLDRDDSMAARWACLQTLVAVERTPLEPLNLPCATSWSAVRDDEPYVWVNPDTDLGLTDRYRQEQVDTLRDRLVRMDPNPGTCEAPWAMAWRKEALKLWRDGQASAACADGAMAPLDRAHLCPTLFDTQDAACKAGAADACALTATLLAAGVGVQADPEEATTRFEEACFQGAATACKALPDHADRLAARIRAEVARAVAPHDEAMTTAMTHAERLSEHLPRAWTATVGVALGEAALALGDADAAEHLITTWTRWLDPIWVASVGTRVADLRAAMPPVEPAPEAATPP